MLICVTKPMELASSVANKGEGGSTNGSPLLQLELKLSWSTEPENTRSPNHCVLDLKRLHGAMTDCCNEKGSSSSTSCGTKEGRDCWIHGDEEDGEGGRARKKLRLSIEQSSYLEETFKEHATLTLKQKLAIAKRLNLRPRQVEVWFQNRRARTKLKQTEVDYEYLKRCCDYLTEENIRLHTDIQELRSLKFPCQNFDSSMQATMLTLCSSCEQAASSENASSEMNRFGFSVKSL